MSPRFVPPHGFVVLLLIAMPSYLGINTCVLEISRLTGQGNRLIDEHFVFLRFRLVLVFLTHVTDRALSKQRARQHHHPYEAAPGVQGGFVSHSRRGRFKTLS